ncbi:unnamed protein product, partial [Allacma fusca]
SVFLWTVFLKVRGD